MVERVKAIAAPPNPRSNEFVKSVDFPSMASGVEGNYSSNEDDKTQHHDDRLLSIVYGPASPAPLTMTFSELLDHHVEVRGDAPAVISHPQNLTVSFRRLWERSIRLALAMAQDGMGKGDLVAISLGSRVEYFETFFACTRLGAALVLLNYAYTESEMLALLKVVRKFQLEYSKQDLRLTYRRAQDAGGITRVRTL